jgi:hypothetical protein
LGGAPEVPSIIRPAVLVVVAAACRIGYDLPSDLDAAGGGDGGGADAVIADAPGSDSRSCAGVPFGPPVLVPEVSSPGQEWSPTLSNDLLTLYFSSDRPGGAGGFDIWMAQRASPTAPFDPPTNLTGLNTASNEGGASISQNDLRLYLQSDMAGPRGLYVSGRASPTDAFGPGIYLDIPISDAASPDVTADERTLYFGSTDPGGMGDLDVWAVTRQGGGVDWEAPANVTAVNTPGYDHAPSIDGSGLTLYLEGDRVDTVAMDVLVASRDDVAEPFRTPVIDPVASVLGTGEYDPDISYDGTTLVMALHRSDGIGLTDVWIASRTCP